MVAVDVLQTRVLNRCTWSQRLRKLFFGDDSGGWGYDTSVEHEAFIAACSTSEKAFGSCHPRGYMHASEWHRGHSVLGGCCDIYSWHQRHLMSVSYGSGS